MESRVTDLCRAAINAYWLNGQPKELKEARDLAVAMLNAERPLAEAERTPWRTAGSLASIDPELMKQPAEGRTLEDLKKTFLPVVVDTVSAKSGETTMSKEEKRAKKAELAKQYPKSAEEWTTEEVMRALMPYVIKLANKYATKRFPIEDAVQQGLIGVMNAIKWDKGMSPFANYAYKPIQSAIRRASMEAGVIKVPEGQYDPEKGVGGIFGSEQFMGQEVGGEEGEAGTLGAILPAASRSREIVRGKIKPGEAKVVTTSTETPTAAEMDRMLHNKELLQKVFKYAKLTPDENKAVTMLFGLDDGVERQGKEVAKELGMSSQRFSELKNKAMAKLVNAAKIVRAMSKFNVPESKALCATAALMEGVVKRIKLVE